MSIQYTILHNFQEETLNLNSVFKFLSELEQWDSPFKGCTFSLEYSANMAEGEYYVKSNVMDVFMENVLSDCIKHILEGGEVTNDPLYTSRHV